jgi:alpha-amylase
MKRFFTFVLLPLVVLATFGGCKNISETAKAPETPFIWDNATVYFMLTDRFNNGNTENDVNFDRTAEVPPLRKFEGGDFKGITKKIEEGYFTKLGVEAIWLSPIAEQIKGYVDEGAGNTYGYHGYWATDWTSIEPNWGTEEELKEMIEAAHKKKIRILFDVVINQIGPVTDKDPVWPEGWVRTEPRCDYSNYEMCRTCTLVENLPDIKTESTEEVELPPQLVEKWKKEGRLAKEQAELDEFFKTTGYPRTPRYYLIKWLVDYIRKYGIDGFRIDTVKHVEESVWAELKKEAVRVYEEYKKANPDKIIDDREFYMLGELYGYGIGGGASYDYGDTTVNYFENGFNSLINFGFKHDAGDKSYEELFTFYDSLLHNPLKGFGALNYITSHDDGGPFDRTRENAIKAGTLLFLTPGGSQIYYGDESARQIDFEDIGHDADLRSFMNWEEIENNATRGGHNVQDVLTHYQKLGTFKKKNPAVGAGRHTMISDSIYTFKRTYSDSLYTNTVVVAMDAPAGLKEISVGDAFEDGTKLKEYYSGIETEVLEGKVTIDTEFDLVLLGK